MRDNLILFPRRMIFSKTKAKKKENRKKKRKFVDYILRVRNLLRIKPN